MHADNTGNGRLGEPLKAARAEEFDFCTEQDFADHAADMFSDMPKYLADASKSAPCASCSGSGVTPMPASGPDREREVLLGLLVACGARTSHTFPGDPCVYCEGSGTDADKQRRLASEKFARDWFKPMAELFTPIPKPLSSRPKAGTP